MSDAVPGIFRAISEEVVPQAEILRDLDSKIGDGDLGITITRGMEAVVAGLGDLEGQPVSDQLSRSGMAFNRAAASTFGVLFATAFMRGGAAVKGKDDVGMDDVAVIGRAALQGMMDRGKANIGDKTLLDALAPAIDAFDEAQRVPRIEYFAGLHPTLHPALDAAGLDLDMEAPVMVRSGPSVLAPPTIEAEPLRTDDDLEAFVANQSIAYGGDAFDTSWVCRLRDGLRNRTTTGATVTEGGEVVAGATVAWVDDIAELAGVWTLPTHRRQGLAAAVCAAAIADIGSDTVLWLSAGPGTGTLYQRLGFRAIGTQLNFIRR